MKYYYLLNGKIMSANEKMPIYDDEKNRYSYDALCVIWHKQLQPCEISESELDKINKFIRAEYNDDYPIEVTEIVEEKTIKFFGGNYMSKCIECKNHFLGDKRWFICENCCNKSRVLFKQPKQVESNKCPTCSGEVSIIGGNTKFMVAKQVEEIEAVDSYETQLKLLRELRQIDVIQGASFALNKFTITRK